MPSATVLFPAGSTVIELFDASFNSIVESRNKRADLVEIDLEML